jgi:hypothetical protein
LVYQACRSREWSANPFSPILPDPASFSTLLYFMIHGDPIAPVSQISSIILSQPNVPAFLEIFHHALATFLGLFGSLLAQYLYATQPREKPTTANSKP